MKNLFLRTMLIIASIVALTSCSDEQPAGGLSGWYSTPPLAGSFGGYTERQKVYNFKNKNTVVTYQTVLNGRHWTYSEPLPEHSGWYIQEGIYYYETYTVVDNKVYITNGDILTIEDGGNKLRMSSWTFTKW